MKQKKSILKTFTSFALITALFFGGSQGVHAMGATQDAKDKQQTEHTQEVDVAYKGVEGTSKKKAKAVGEELEDTGAVAFAVGAKASDQMDVTFEVGEEVSYGGWFTRKFYINGNLAYCLEPELVPPGEGQYVADIIRDNNSLLSKGLYYLMGGPGWTEELRNGIFPEEMAENDMYCMCHVILSYIYSGCDAGSSAFVGLPQATIDGLINITDYIATLPAAPDTRISFEAAENETYFDAGLGMQRTKDIKLNADAKNSVDVATPEGAVLVYDGKEHTGKATVKGGTSFYLKADVDYQNGETWKSGMLKGSNTNTWKALALNASGGTQTIGGWTWITDPTIGAEFSVDWLEKPEPEIVKTVDKPDKTYKDGDLMTYTLDITEKVQRAVGKNLVITDTIIEPEEGVKLQKASIVLMDKDKNVIDDAKITVKGNSFTIATGESLKFTQSVEESGQHWYVEYQVKITDASKIQEVVHNEATAKFSNSILVKGEEDVIIEPQEIKLHTTATDKETGEKTIDAKGNVTIVDKVKITGLKVGKEYKLTGWQMVKQENAELVIDGKKVASDYTFKAEKSEMEVEMAFTFDADKLAGKDLVTFEELYDMKNPEEPKKVAEHKDINDEGQTVHVREEGEISIHTTATNGKDGSKKLDAEKGQKITDKVKLAGLTAGKQYKLTGWQMVKQENAELANDGKRVESDYTFTATSESMEVEITFTLDASRLAGKDLVTYEELYDVDNPEKPVKVAEHKDISDEGQTVHVEEPEKPEVSVKDAPKTGDAFPVIPAVVILAGVIAAVIGIIIKKRKK